LAFLNGFHQMKQPAQILQDTGHYRN